MTRDQAPAAAATTTAEVKKAWIEPELDVFPMSEAENTHPVQIVPDSLTVQS